MVQIISTPLANSQASLFADTFADGFVDFYDSDPNTGTLLAECKLPIMPFGQPVNGLVSLAGQWFGSTVQGGVTTWARFRDPASSAYYDVTVSMFGGGGQIIVTNTTLTFGDVVSIIAFTYRAPTG